MQNPKRTRVKAFRLSYDLLGFLSRAAERLSVSENAFVSNVLRARLRIDPLVPAVGGIWLGESTFRLMLDTMSVDRLEPVSFSLGKENYFVARELFGAQELHLTFLQYVKEILGDYAKWFNFESPESARVVTLHHGYSLKWSLFLKGYLLGAHSVVSHDRMDVVIKEGIVKMTLT